MSKDQILKLVEAKKSKVGGGYLTDKGALFLVASDLGVSLRIDETRPKLEDLEKYQNDVSVIARILSIGPPKKFARKSDSSAGFVSKLIVYDSTSVVPVSVWSPNIVAQLLEVGTGPGSAVKISKAYVREGPDGSHILNLSENGEVRVFPDSDPSALEIPKLEQKIMKTSEALKAQIPLIVRGKIKGPVRRSEFTRKTGTLSYLTSFGMMAEGFDSETRVVLWENPNPIFEELKEGELVTLLNVRAKESGFQGSRSLELHGDEATIVLEKWDQTSKWISQLALGLGVDFKTNSRSQIPGDAKPQQVLAFVARIVSIGQQWDEEKNAAHLLLCDSAKRKISLTALNDAARDVSELNVDDAIICKPDSLDQVGLKATCSRAGSLSKVRSERKDIPNSTTLLLEVERLVAPTIVSLDVMSLSEPSAREVQTKEGLVKRTELAIGDPTGQIKIYAWRGLSKYLDKIPAGSRLKFEAVEIQSHEGKTFVVFKNYSRISYTA